MVFAVLCLTIFSVLSLVTANSDLRLTRRAALSISDYYDAEFLAEERVMDISKRLRGAGAPKDLLIDMEGVGVRENGVGSAINFKQTIDSRRDLYVELVFDSNRELLVTEWKLIPNDSGWNPDGGTAVWLGD